MRLLLDEMYSERVAELLSERDHDAVHLRSIGLGGAPDVDVLSRAVDERRTTGREVGGTLNARLAVDIDNWAADNADPYAHARWLP